MTNLRYLVSRNKREGWYVGKTWTVRHNGIKKCHRRNLVFGIRHKELS